MEYRLDEFTYPSSDGVTDIAGYAYIPFDDNYKGIVQIVHGMSEYFLRYEPFCEYLVNNGYIVCGNDHLGHGYTATCPSGLGYIAESDGADMLASDVYMLSEIIKERFPKLPHVLLGHSMGSFIARYCISLYPEMTDSCIIMGTAGPGNPAKLGKIVALINKKMRGEYNRSGLINAMAFGSYNKTFPKDEGQFAWLTSVSEEREKYENDPLAGFPFTASGFRDLFDLIDKVNNRGWAAKINKTLPVLLVSGLHDPVGDYGRGVVKVCEMLAAEGVENLRCKIYKDSRHEILNDVERKTVYEDLFAWIDGICKATAEMWNEE